MRHCCCNVNNRYRTPDAATVKTESTEKDATAAKTGPIEKDAPAAKAESKEKDSTAAREPAQAPEEASVAGTKRALDADENTSEQDRQKRVDAKES